MTYSTKGILQRNADGAIIRVHNGIKLEIIEAPHAKTPVETEAFAKQEPSDKRESPMLYIVALASLPLLIAAFVLPAIAPQLFQR